MNLTESSLIITGAAGNIGESLVLELSKVVNTVIALDFDKSVLTKFSSIANVKARLLDVTSESGIKDLFSEVEIVDKNVGLINAAGVIYNRPLVNILDKKSPVHSLEDFSKVIQLNLTGTFLMGSNFAHYCIRKRKRACIINFSSVTASGNVGQSAYSASKAGVEALSRVWAKELGMFKIRAASISPGFFDTHSTANNLSESTIKTYKSNIPLKKFGQLEDILGGIRFILENEYFTGEVLSLNGGFRI